MQMTAVLTIIWAALGFVIGTFTATGLGPLFGFGSTEGNSAIFGVLLGGPTGAILGGIFAYRRFRHESEQQQRKVIGYTVLGALALALSGFLSPGYLFNDSLSPNGTAWSIVFEIKVPGSPPSREDVRIGLKSPKDDRKAILHDGMWLKPGPVISGYFEVYQATPERVMTVQIADGPPYSYKITTTRRTDTFGPWQSEGGAPEMRYYMDGHD